MWTLLWSINERLDGNPGLDVEPPTQDWMLDVMELAKLEAEVAEDARGVSDDMEDDLL